MIEEGLVSYLMSYGPLAALIGTRLWPNTLEQEPTLPAVVYQIIDEDEEYSQSGPSNLENVRVQFACWAETPLGAASVADVLRLALSGFSGSMGLEEVQAVFKENGRTDFEPETGLHRRLFDIVMWHRIKG